MKVVYHEDHRRDSGGQDSPYAVDYEESLLWTAERVPGGGSGSAGAKFWEDSSKVVEGGA
jgi:hypothetical protein